MLWAPPKLDLVAVWVVNPSETAVIVFLSLGIDLDPMLLEFAQQGFEIIHHVVDHEARRAWIEVLRGARESVPNCDMLLVGILVRSPAQRDALAGMWRSPRLS